MLGKLLKYDIKFGKSAFLLMSGVLILLGIFLRLFFSDFTENMGASIIYILVIVGVTTASIVMIFQNFHRNLFSSEGYLMLTLPVKRYKLIVSKLLVTILWVHFILLAVFVMMRIIFYKDFSFFEAITLYDVVSLLTIWLTVILLIINIALFLYMASAVAHISIAGKRPGWWLGGLLLVCSTALEIWFGINVLEPMISNWVLWIAKPSGYDGFVVHVTENVIMLYSSIESCISIHLSFPITMLLFILCSWMVTWHCLQKRVDLP